MLVNRYEVNIDASPTTLRDNAAFSSVDSFAFNRILFQSP